MQACVHAFDEQGSEICLYHILPTHSPKPYRVIGTKPIKNSKLDFYIQSFGKWLNGLHYKICLQWMPAVPCGL